MIPLKTLLWLCQPPSHPTQKLSSSSFTSLTWFISCLYYLRASLVAQSVKYTPAMQETLVLSLSWEDPLEKRMATPVFLPGEFHGQRSPAGYSPRGRKESDMHNNIWEENEFFPWPLLPHLQGWVCCLPCSSRDPSGSHLGFSTSHSPLGVCEEIQLLNRILSEDGRGL